jgi:hypothetical protein
VLRPLNVDSCPSRAPVRRAGIRPLRSLADGFGPPGRSRSRTCRLPRSETRRRPNLNLFRGSMAGLCAPLPTLRPPSHERIRTARGRGGSLRLPRDGLAPSTLCRSPGALRKSSKKLNLTKSLGTPPYSNGRFRAVTGLTARTRVSATVSVSGLRGPESRRTAEDMRENLHRPPVPLRPYVGQRKYNASGLTPTFPAR